MRTDIERSFERFCLVTVYYYFYLWLSDVFTVPIFNDLLHFKIKRVYYFIQIPKPYKIIILNNSFGPLKTCSVFKYIYIVVIFKRKLGM